MPTDELRTKDEELRMERWTLNDGTVNGTVNVERSTKNSTVNERRDEEERHKTQGTGHRRTEKVR